MVNRDTVASVLGVMVQVFIGPLSIRKALGGRG